MRAGLASPKSLIRKQRPLRQLPDFVLGPKLPRVAADMAWVGDKGTDRVRTLFANHERLFKEIIWLNCFVHGTRFEGVVFTKGRFIGTRFAKCFFVGTPDHHNRFDHCDLSSVLFDRCTFKYCDFNFSKLDEARFENCVFIHCTFAGNVRSKYSSGKRLSFAGNDTHIKDLAVTGYDMSTLNIEDMLKHKGIQGFTFEHTKLLAMGIEDVVMQKDSFKFVNCDMAGSAFINVAFQGEVFKHTDLSGSVFLGGSLAGFHAQGCNGSAKTKGRTILFKKNRQRLAPIIASATFSNYDLDGLVIEAIKLDGTLTFENCSARRMGIMSVDNGSGVQAETARQEYKGIVFAGNCDTRFREIRGTVHRCVKGLTES